MGEGHDAIFSPLSVIDANLARIKIDVRQSNVDQLADPNADIHQRFDDHHVLKVFRLPDHLVVSLQFVFGGDVG